MARKSLDKGTATAWVPPKEELKPAFTAAPPALDTMAVEAVRTAGTGFMARLKNSAAPLADVHGVIFWGLVAGWAYFGPIRLATAFTSMGDWTVMKLLGGFGGASLLTSALVTWLGWKILYPMWQARCARSGNRIPQQPAYQAPPPPSQQASTVPAVSAPPQKPRERVEDVLAELDAMTGLDGVKSRARAIMAALALDGDMAANDITSDTTNSKHLAFTGNPGTGKTVVARLITRLYHALGVLETGQLIEVSRADLVGAVWGETEKKTKDAIQRAMGGVLFVDEAYTLMASKDDPFGKAAVETIMKAMEDHRDRLVVIIAGYEEEIDGFLQVNPGLRSRFPAPNYVRFDDYSPDEMFSIFQGYLKSSSLVMDNAASAAVHRRLTELHAGRRKGFGNARAVREDVLSVIKDNRNRRLTELRAANGGQPLTREQLTTIIEADIIDQATEKLSVGGETLEELLAKLNGMTGLGSVKDAVDRVAKSAKTARLKKIGGLKVTARSRHLAFLGNPGTGKTTVARLVGDIYRVLGVVKRGHVVEVSRQDLVGAVWGETEKKTQAIIEKARDGVLFIDEAYTLKTGDDDKFGLAAIDIILKAMEDMRESLVVIVAGYDREMERFFDANPGMRSRIPTANYVQFEDYTGPELLKIFTALVVKEGMSIDKAALELVSAAIERLYATRGKGFGNARSVRDVFERICDAQDGRVATLGGEVDSVELARITEADVEEALRLGRG